MKKKTPKEMEDEVDIIIGYVALGLIALLVIIIIMLVFQLIVGFLTAIGMGV